MINVIIAPDNLPVTLVEARRHCEAPENGDDDVLVDRALKAAVDYCERKTGLVFWPQTLELRLPGWPCFDWRLPSGIIDLPRGPVRDVVSVEYVDEDGIVTESAAANYTWKRTAEGARVRFKSDYSFPTLTDEEDDGVRVTFEAGFDDPAVTGSGDDPILTLPPTIPIAILMMTEWWYGNRSAAGVDPTHPLVLAVDAILSQVRVYR